MNRCSGCGRTIIWGVDPDGQKIPLDASAPCYKVRGFVGDVPQIERDRAVLVSHFVTCTMASKFTKKGRTELAQAMRKAEEAKTRKP